MSYHDNKRVIIEAFKQGKEKKFSGLNLWTNGVTIFSYGQPLVTRLGDGSLGWWDEKPGFRSSITTSRHLGFIKAWLKV